MGYKSLEEFIEMYKDIIDRALDGEDVVYDTYPFKELGKDLVNDILTNTELFEYRGCILAIDEDNDGADFFYICRDVLPEDSPIEDIEYIEVTTKNDSKVLFTIEGTPAEINDFISSLESNPEYKNVKKARYEKIYRPLPEEELSLIEKIKEIIDHKIFMKIEGGKDLDSFWTVPSFCNEDLISELLELRYHGHILVPLDDPDKSISQLTYLNFKIEEE